MFKKDSNINCLQNEIEQKNRLINEYYLSLKILNTQASQIQDLEIRLFDLRQKIEYYEDIFSGKQKSFFLRGAYFLINKNIFLNHVLKRIKNIYKQNGYIGVYKKINEKIYLKIQNKYPRVDKIVEAFKKNIKTHSALPDEKVSKINLIINNQFSKKTDFQSELILIVAEVVLPQCYKYRVQQKKEYFEKLGWKCKIVDWRNQVEVLSVLQICKIVIFYRVPGFPNVLEQISESKRLGLSPWWEVDDLIFDEKLYLQCGFIEKLPKKEVDLLLFGSRLFRTALLACDHAIASTPALAHYMQYVGMKEVVVIENALDKHTVEIAAEYYPESKKTDFDLIKNKDEVVLIYGSGTNTHNADFLVAANGILSALLKEKSLRFWIVGEIELPENFKSVEDQIRFMPFQSFEQYMELLAQADIAIAPLEDIGFNDAKSNIKYLEASILGLASVCSPRQAFTKIIQDHKNGLLASSEYEWKEKILLLARNPQLRKQLGQQAYHDVINHYSLTNIMQKQVEPVFRKVSKKGHDKLKILIVNLHYDPYSFGGATLVAEEMAQRIKAEKNVEITVFTTRPHSACKGLHRYKSKESIVYSIELLLQNNPIHKFNNIEVIEPFDMVLETVQPDIVHFHAIQNMGLQMVSSCQRMNIPYIVTLHDTWWLCNRTFMFKSDYKYCFQEKIDLNVCRYCDPNASYLNERLILMKEALSGASLLLSPSKSHRELYVANDIDPEKIVVNRNGVNKPKKKRIKRPANAPLRFGFVSGDEIVKGFFFVFDVFRTLQRSDWQLTIVDSKVNMGYPPINVKSWNVKGKIKTVLPYNVDTIDDFFNNIDVLLFPSQLKESYGLTVREALLRDVWVVCTSPGAQAEDVRDGVNGTYIPLRADYKVLKKVVEDLIDRTSFFNTYVNPYKDHIMTFEQQADELYQYYNRVMQEKGKKHLVS